MWLVSMRSIKDFVAYEALRATPPQRVVSCKHRGVTPLPTSRCAYALSRYAPPPDPPPCPTMPLPPLTVDEHSFSLSRCVCLLRVLVLTCPNSPRCVSIFCRHVFPPSSLCVPG